MTNYTNEQVVASKSKLARRVSLGGLAVMLPGMFLALGGLVNTALQNETSILVSYISLIVGTIVATIGGRMAERWLIEPRDDQKLEKALKGLDKRYRLVNYFAPADHILLTPGGLYVAVLKDEKGSIRFDGKRWSQPSSLGRLWREWRHGGLGHPTYEAEVQIKKLQAWLESKVEGGAVAIKPLILFTSPDAALDIAAEYDTIMPLKNLKPYLLRHKDEALASADYLKLANAVTPQSEPTAEDAEDEETPQAESALAPGRRERRRKRRK